MKLYYHHVGQHGAQKDFPKTVFEDVDLSTIETHVPTSEPSRSKLINLLKDLFPSRKFNCWGVPAGAKSVVRHLSPGDVVLLVESTHTHGMVPALCEVRVFLPIGYPALSEALWGEAKYPYIFFFRTERIGLSWLELLEAFGYKSNFNPRGKFYSVADTRLKGYDNSGAFVASLRQRHGAGANNDHLLPTDCLTYEFREETSPEYRAEVHREFQELQVQSLTKEPLLTEEELQPPTPRLVTPRRAAFRASVKELYQKACAVCGLKIHSPKGEPEVEAAHIYPKAMKGSDDLRNGICLCRFHHWAFDVGWFSILDDLTIVVRPDIPASEGFAGICQLSGRKLRLPEIEQFWPHPLFLREHRRIHGFE